MDNTKFYKKNTKLQVKLKIMLLFIAIVVIFLYIIFISAEGVNEFYETFDSGGHSVGVEITNLSVKLDYDDRFYFNEVNILKIYVYDNNTLIDADNISFFYYNYSDIYVNELELEKIDEGVYFKRLYFDKLNNISERDITIKAIANKNNKFSSSSINVTISDINIIEKIELKSKDFYYYLKKNYIKFRDAIRETPKYVLYPIFIFMFLVLISVVLYIIISKRYK